MTTLKRTITNEGDDFLKKFHKKFGADACVRLCTNATLIGVGRRVVNFNSPLPAFTPNVFGLACPALPHVPVVS